jgi:glutathione synthase/RimK-type ligase-like ATP-grasp enzyme
VTPFVVLGNPGSERVTGFQAALERRGGSPATVLRWEDVLCGRAPLSESLPPGALLRIESPGEHSGVERLLLERGAELPDERFDAPRLGAAASRALEDDVGRILHPRQYFLGLRHALEEVARILDARPDLTAMNDPRELIRLLDKPTADELLRRAGVPRPPVLGTPRSFAELVELMKAEEASRVFVKLANGSSASGVVAYQAHGGRQIAVTSTELARRDGRIRLYNSKRLRRYTLLSETRVLFDALCREGVLVERWIPKASLPGGSFDLRVLVIGGRARHVVVRQSPTPLTNLHLGRKNRRGDPELARERMGEAAWRSALEACERAAAVFPGCLYAGVDLLVASRSYRPFVAEANAFGDLLRRALHDGRTPYEAEIEQALGVPA